MPESLIAKFLAKTGHLSLILPAAFAEDHRLGPVRQYAFPAFYVATIEDTLMTSLAGGAQGEGAQPQDDQGAGGELESLASVHYPELLDIARRELRRLHDAATLDTRAVLHEAFLRLVAQDKTTWEDRSQFLAAAAGTMRRVLIDHVRHRHAGKRGGGRMPITLDEELAGTGPSDETLVALDDALTELARLSPRLARVVECRYFGGMTEVETADALQVTERTIRRDWTKARGWLQVMLKEARCM